MELSGYAELAVRLVNTEDPGRGRDQLATADDVRALCAPYPQLARRASDGDVPRLRAVRSRLRAVFTAADEGDPVRAVDLLNALLAEYPASPRISGHSASEDGPHWHMHLAGPVGTTSAGYAANACTGLAFHLTGAGADRLGVCAAAPCRNAYLDTSANRSRRFCTERCASRAHVAAYRARRRGGLRSGRTAPSAQPTADGTER